MFAYINKDNSIFCISSTSLKKKIETEGYTKDKLDDTGAVIWSEYIEPVFVDDPVFLDLIEKEFDNEKITNPIYDPISKKIIQFESDIEKKEKLKKEKFEQFIATQDFSDFDWEGVDLTTNEYSQLITARDFSWDNWSQVAMLTKALFKCMAIFVQLGIPKETMQTVFADEIQVANKVSESRVALGLSPFELPI